MAEAAHSENVAARFAFQVRDRSGYNRNVLLNRDLDDLQSYQARAQLQFGHPGDDLRALLSVEYGHDESNGTNLAPSFVGRAVSSLEPSLL